MKLREKFETAFREQCPEHVDYLTTNDTEYVLKLDSPVEEIKRFFVVDDGDELTLYWGEWHWHYPCYHEHDDEETNHKEAVVELVADIQAILNNRCIYHHHTDEDGQEQYNVIWLTPDSKFFTWKGPVSWNNE